VVNIEPIRRKQSFRGGQRKMNRGRKTIRSQEGSQGNPGSPQWTIQKENPDTKIGLVDSVQTKKQNTVEVYSLKSLSKEGKVSGRNSPLALKPKKKKKKNQKTQKKKKNKHTQKKTKTKTQTHTNNKKHTHKTNTNQTGNQKNQKKKKTQNQISI